MEDKKVQSLINSNLTRKILDQYLDYIKKYDDFDPSEFAGFISKELFSAYSDMCLREEGDEDVFLGIKNEKGEIELIKNELEKLNLKEELEKIAKEIKVLEGKKRKNTELNKLRKKFSTHTKKLTKLRRDD
jgi:vacuolar-type H+-ATPase subunit I/STV1